MCGRAPVSQRGQQRLRPGGGVHAVLKYHSLGCSSRLFQQLLVLRKVGSAQATQRRFAALLPAQQLTRAPAKDHSYPS